MALKIEYLASANAAAERRSQALHRFIVGSPIVLLLAVGLVGHVHPKPYAHPASNALYDRHVLAYRDRVVRVETMVAGAEPSPGSLESEAKRWIAGFTSGDLVAIPPAVYEDHLRDGARGQIVRAGLALATALNLRAEFALQDGRYADAGREALFATETARGLRGFDVQAFLQSLLSSRRGLGLLERAWPHLSSAERSPLLQRLRPMVVDEHEVEALVQTDMRQTEDYKLRQKVADLGPFLVNVGKASIAAASRSVRMTNERIRSLTGSGS